MAGEQLIQGRGWGLEKSRIQVCSEASACLGSGGPLWGGGWGSQTWEPHGCMGPALGAWPGLGVQALGPYGGAAIHKAC